MLLKANRLKTITNTHWFWRCVIALFNFIENRNIKGQYIENELFLKPRFFYLISCMDLYEVERFKDNHPISHKPVQNIIPHRLIFFFIYWMEYSRERERGKESPGSKLHFPFLKLRENVLHRSYICSLLNEVPYNNYFYLFCILWFSIVYILTLENDIFVNYIERIRIS